MMHAPSSTRLNRRVAALLALTLAALVFAPSVALAQSPPVTPSAVTVTRSDGSITASGYGVSDATKYHITYSSDGGYGWTAASDNHTGTSITISGADNSKSYIVAVRAGNANGWSGWRNSSAIAPITPPGTVQSLVAARSGTSIAVSWSAPANTGGLTITGYDVNYSTNGAASWTRAVSGTNSTSADISNADNTVDYIISVRAEQSVRHNGDHRQRGQLG